MSTCRPDATSCQPRSCTGVGPSNELRNQSRVAGAKRSRDVPTRSSLTGSWRTNKRSLTGWRRLAEAHAMYPFERFNEDAKRSLTLAQEEAERSHHSYIGTEHLLLGLLRVEKGTAHRVLTELGVDIQTVREVIKSVLGRSERILVQSIIPTSRVKKVIELSFEEARRMGDNEVDTVHMLLGLIIEGEGIAAHVLTDLGATLVKVRLAIEQARTPGQARPSAHRPPPPRNEPIPYSSDATALLDLLSKPHVAKLLKSKGV